VMFDHAGVEMIIVTRKPSLQKTSKCHFNSTTNTSFSSFSSTRSSTGANSAVTVDSTDAPEKCQAAIIETCGGIRGTIPHRTTFEFGTQDGRGATLNILQ
ncbi:3339_t:CDS:2, partial [Paraglomus brasilianum]